MLATRSSTRAVGCDLNVHFINVSCLQCSFREPATQTADATGGLHNQIIFAQIVWSHPDLVLDLTTVKLFIVPALRGQMLIWHFGEVLFSQIHAIVWASSLLMFYGGGGVMVWYDMVLKAMWMDRDTVTRFWGPLSYHLSTAITPCCSMIMHCPCCNNLYTIPAS